MKMAYADPPYPGEAKKHYSDDPNCAEVDHPALIAALQLEYPDGWALSTKEPALRDLLPLCPARARVMPWVKPFCSFKPGVGVAYAWEPVIVVGGRRRSRAQDTVRDWVSANITLKKGVHGAKPPEFCYWLFEVLNLEPEDEFVDMFPGSRAVSEAWERWRNWKSNAPLQLELLLIG
jgi:hypothetical protein